MPFKIDFLDDRVLEWEATADGAVATERRDYTPRFYAAPRSSETDVDLAGLQAFYERHPDVVATEFVDRRPGFRRDAEQVLAVDVSHIDRVPALARQTGQLSEYPIGDVACFNVDFSREFRYCLENGVNPTPASELSTLHLSIPVTETNSETYAELGVDGDTVTGPPEDLLATVQDAIDTRDPDCPRVLDERDHPGAVRDGHKRWRR